MFRSWTGNEIKHAAVQRTTTTVVHDESGGVIAEAPIVSGPMPWLPGTNEKRGLMLGPIGSERRVFVTFGYVDQVWTVTACDDVHSHKVLVKTLHLPDAMVIAESWWRRGVRND